MHRRYGNQLHGVASVDLSGHHEATPVPGHCLGAMSTHYFPVVIITFIDEDGH